MSSDRGEVMVSGSSGGKVSSVCPGSTRGTYIFMYVYVYIHTHMYMCMYTQIDR